MTDSEHMPERPSKITLPTNAEIGVNSVTTLSPIKMINYLEQLQCPATSTAELVCLLTQLGIF